MKHYAEFHATGLPMRFFNDDVFPDVPGEIEDPTSSSSWWEDLDEVQGPDIVPSIETMVRNPAIPDDAVELTEEQYREFMDNQGSRRWDGGAVVAYAPVLDMPTLRQAAFETAMAYGNGITARVTGTYSDVEARTWPLQRTQADTVLHGGELPADALLRKLATRRGMELEAFALLVQHKAEAFETIADVGQGLRLGAEGLLAEAIDTPEKLDAAVEVLRAQTLAAAGDLGLTV